MHKPAILFALIPALALGACVAGPPPEMATPVPELPSEFMFAAGASSDASVAQLLPRNDPAYQALASQALADSPTLAEAIARIDQARAGAARAGANQLPNVGANGSVTGSRTNLNIPATSPFSIETEQVSYSANLVASWDPDIFGVLRAQERAAVARIDAAQAGAAAVRLALLAEIAGTVIDWRTIEARQIALQRDLDAAQELVRLSRLREDAGIAPGFDTVRAATAAASSRSRLASLASERNRLAGRLVTLTAQPMPQVLETLAQPAPPHTLPDAPETAPSVLLTNRPDVLRSAANLTAADAELAATARSRFPQFDLSAALGLLSFDLGDLLDEDSIVGSLAASVAAPLLDFGRLEAEIDGAEAEKRAAFQAYRGAVYTALGDAETGYGLVASTDAEAEFAIAERNSAERAASLANTRFEAGLADFLTVLDARRTADASGERAAAAIGRARRARVLLWQALGGDSQTD